MRFFSQFISQLGFLGFEVQQDYSTGDRSPDASWTLLKALPPGFESVSAAFIRDNLAVIPGEWETGDLSKY